MDHPGELPNLSGEVKILSYKHVAVGPYSTVYRGTWKSKNELVAIKLMNSIYGVSLHVIRRKIKREGKTWSALQHPNILPLYGFVNGDEDDEFFQPFGAFISPWRQRGDLAQYLAERGESAPLEERLDLWTGIVAGVTYLHVNNPVLVHGDLKPRNVLIDDSGNAQICDFGLVRVYLEEGSSGMTTTTAHTGTDRYLAYELVMEKENAIPTTASDIYATGCIGLEIAFLETPYKYSGSNFRWYMLQAMQEGIPPAICPTNLPEYLNSLWKVVSRCWARDPTLRPDARALSMDLRDVMRELGPTEMSQSALEAKLDASLSDTALRSGDWGTSESGSVEDHTANERPSGSGLQIHISHDFSTNSTPVTPTATKMTSLPRSSSMVTLIGANGIASPDGGDGNKSVESTVGSAVVVNRDPQGGMAKQPRAESRSLFAQLNAFGINISSGINTDRPIGRGASTVIFDANSQFEDAGDTGVAGIVEAIPDTSKAPNVGASGKNEPAYSLVTQVFRDFQLTIFGADTVEKIALALRFVKGHVKETIDPTTEDFYTRIVTLDGETSRVKVFDTAGMGDYAVLADHYIKEAHGFILAFSLTDQTTLREIEVLRERILRIKGDRIPIVAVGTDSDLPYDRQISRNRVTRIGARWGVPVYEVSIEQSLNITEAFENILRQMRRYQVAPPSPTKKGSDAAKWGIISTWLQ